jgi:ureidoacrylate peracid hydrolase
MNAASLRTLSDQVDPRVAALLIIDMQNDFCHPQGVSGKRGRQLTMTIEMAPRLEAFINACRAVGIPAVFVQTMHYPWTDSPSWLRRLQKDPGDSVCRPGTWGAEFYGGIQPRDGEIVITKHRYSAFFGTDLDLILRTMHDYYTVMLEDCVGATDEGLHQATLKNVKLHFGVVTTSTEVTKLWSV